METRDKESVVRGGANPTPCMSPPPPRVPLRALLRTYADHAVVRTGLATGVVFALQPRFRAWMRGYVAAGGSTDGAFALALTATHAAIYLGGFALTEFVERAGWLQYYRLACTKGQEPAFATKLGTLKDVLLGQIPYYLGARVLWRLCEARGAAPGTEKLPSFLRVWGTFVAAFVLHYSSFYTMHRLFHWGPLYRAFHSMHHRYTGTTAVAAEHAHPVEHVGANLVPVLAGVVLLRAHMLPMLVWTAWRILEAVEGHSGYCFVGSPLHALRITLPDGGAYHTYHHVANKGNFGDPLADHFPDATVGSTIGWVLGLAAGAATRGESGVLPGLSLGFALGSAIGHVVGRTPSTTCDAWLAKGGQDAYVSASRKMRMAEGHFPLLGSSSEPSSSSSSSSSSS